MIAGENAVQQRGFAGPQIAGQNCDGYLRHRKSLAVWWRQGLTRATLNLL
jgi:hypothetical protein